MCVLVLTSTLSGSLSSMEDEAEDFQADVKIFHISDHCAAFVDSCVVCYMASLHLQIPEICSSRGCTVRKSHLYLNLRASLDH